EDNLSISLYIVCGDLFNSSIYYTKSTKGIRDRVRISRLANSLEDVNWFANTFMDIQYRLTQIRRIV
ncbi:MAG: hypothetical protein WA667_19500, partial [Candidatus Nitrosopolaris sp.]